MRKIKQFLLTTAQPTQSGGHGHSVLFKLLCLLCFLCYGLTAQASSVQTINGIRYVLNDDKTATVTTKSGGTDKYTDATISIPNTVKYSNITYNVTVIGSHAFDGCSKVTTVNIPNNVKTIESYAFMDCGITSITIPSNVESISSGAFRGCSALVSATINSSKITEISYLMFSNCSKLSSVNIPSSVTTIEESAFDGCSSLTSLTIPNKVESIGKRALYNCSSLTEIVFERETAPTFGSSAIYYTNNCPLYVKTAAAITSYKNVLTDYASRIQIKPIVVNGIKYQLQEDGTYAVLANDYSGNVEIPNTIKYNGVTTVVGSIKDNAFKKCTNLTTVTIHQNITSIGSGAFVGCTSLTSINVDAQNENYCSIDGVLYNKNIKKLICCPAGKTGTLSIPESVTAIDNNAVNGCASLTSVIIPNGVTLIGQYAFKGCSSLSSVIVPNSVETIGFEAFNGCSGLTSISLPFVGYERRYSYDFSSYGTVYHYPFGYIFGTNSYSNSTMTNQTYRIKSNGVPKNQTTTYYLPASLREVVITDSYFIPQGAFYNCGCLTSITIPSTVSAIGDAAFYYCSNVEEFIFERETSPTFGSNDFQYTNSNSCIFVPTEAAVESYQGANNMSSYSDRVMVNPYCTITVAANSNDYGVVTGGGKFDKRKTPTTTISAVANDHYRFVRWEDNGEGYTDVNREITISGNAAYTAIFKRVLTVSNVKAENKVYDGTATATINSYETDELEDDVVTVSSTATFEDKNVGTNKTVTYHFEITGGANADDYVLASTTGTTSASITVKEVSTPTVELSETSFTYNGSVQKPTVTVKDGEIIIPDTEYEVVFPNDVVNVGQKEVSITDKEGGNYSISGTTTTFGINVKRVTNPAILLPSVIYYNVEGVTPSITLKDGETTINGDEYTVKYTNNINVGDAIVTVTDKDGGNYEFDECTASFTINPRIVNATIKLSETMFYYDGTAKEPDVISAKDEYTEIPQEEYTVEYENNVEVGIATVRLRDAEGGNYTVSGSTTFGIRPYIPATQPALSNGFYQISTPGELFWFAAEVNSGNTAINGKLVANIVVNDDVLANDGKSLKYNAIQYVTWTPIGNSTHRYSGIFDGNGYTVSGLYFEEGDTDDIGLFGYASGATIQNVGVEDSYFKAYKYIGGICGFNVNSTVTNCFNEAVIYGEGYVGGICGKISAGGSVTGCYNTAYISCYQYVGGICGQLVASSITNCYNTGNLLSTAYNTYVEPNEYGHGGGATGHCQYLGGICGQSTYENSDNKNSYITNCYNVGRVSYTASYSGYLGGICGYKSDYTSISKCYYLKSNVASGCNATGGYFKEYEIADVENQYMPATTAQFADGTVTFGLNGGSINGAWYQTIGVDAYPVLDQTHGRMGTLVAEGDIITVSGDYVFTENYIIPEGKTLVIPADASVRTIGSAVITNSGTIKCNGTISGNNLDGAGSFVYDNNLVASDITLNTTSYTYKGSAYTIGNGLDVTVGRQMCGKTFTYDGSAIVTYSNNSNAGEANAATATWNGTISKQFTITPKEVTLEWSNTSLTYNGSAQAPSATATGLIEGDECSVTVSGAQTNAGSNYTATASALSKANYKLPAAATSTFSIAAKEVGLEWSNTAFTYNGSAQAPTATATSLVEGDECLVTVGGAQTNAGSNYTATASALSNANYTLPATATTAFSIAAKEVGLNWSNTPLTYNGSEQMPTATATGLVGNDECNVIVSGAQTNFGSYTATAERLSNGNYKLPNNKTKAFTIDQKVVTLEWGTASFTYNGSEQAPTATATGLVDGDVCNVTVSGAQIDADTYTATASTLSNNNYKLPENKTKAFTINPKEVSLVWSNTTFTYNGLAQVPTATATDLVGNDACEVIVSGAQINADTYTATAERLSNGNYKLPEAKTTAFTINPKEVSLVWSETSFTYNGSAQAPTATATGLEEGDECNVTVEGAQINHGNNYTATATGLSNANYKLPTAVTTTFSIAQATPGYTMPDNQTIACNQTLADITLPAGFAFADVNTILAIGENTVGIIFTPEDAENYKVVDDIEITVTVNHSEVTDPAVPATCTATGLTEGSHCSVCEQELVAQEVVPMIKHTAVTDAAVPATCTATGLTEGSHCSVCDHIIVAQEVVPMAEHTESEAVKENEVAATCTENGSYNSVVYCSVCHAELSRETVTVTAPGHTAGAAVAENPKAATCTAAGSVDSVVYCTVCNAEISRKTVEIPVIAHTVVVDEAIAATTTETGLTEGSHCSVCGHVIVAQEIIPVIVNGGGQGGNENQGGNEQGNENQGNENQGNENQGNENQGNENNQGQGGEENNQGEENQVNEGQGNENQGGNEEGNENQGEENQGGNEGQGEENQGEENQGGNEEGNENQGEENQGGNEEGNENQGEENQGGNEEGNENQGGNEGQGNENQDNENQGGNENEGGNENTNPGTAVDDTDALAVNIFAYGNTIVVENADADILVFDAMGRMISRTIVTTDRTELQVERAGVYVVKTGNTAKRVMIND